MKHAIFFAGVMGIILSGGAARAAFPADAAADTYPAYTEAAQTTTGGTQYAAEAVKDKNIKLATTKYLDHQADTANTAVQTLSNTANTDNTTVTANAGHISTMESDRQVVPGNECDNLESQYIACGYIVPDGTDTTSDSTELHDSQNYQWVKIIATVDAVTAAGNASSGA